MLYLYPRACHQGPCGNRGASGTFCRETYTFSLTHAWQERWKECAAIFEMLIGLSAQWPERPQIEANYSGSHQLKKRKQKHVF